MCSKLHFCRISREFTRNVSFQPSCSPTKWLQNCFSFGTPSYMVPKMRKKVSLYFFSNFCPYGRNLVSMVSTSVMWCSVLRVYIANISPTQSTVQWITCQVCTSSLRSSLTTPSGTGLAKCCNSSVEQLWHCRNVTLLPRKRHCKSKQGQVWNTKPKCQTRVVWKWGLGETGIAWVVLVYVGTM